ncbi:vWA domain-containing protein [Polyangium sp. 6x1]|uniref:vWA domain-containing protein n=1 Tax=Polyangium sp. 6x1 TaxID=3042689 RepID=UPI0024830332|nr:vWA domain-containing protein [Polyangium sp. 6x1]
MSAGGRASRFLGAFVVVATVGLSACAPPALTRDGQLVFAPSGGRRGASVITANGVEFMDATELPKPVVRRSPNDPWTPPTGFLVPKDGIWRKTSSPVALSGRGLAVVVRSSDTLVPSWGGEVLLRIDAIAPADAFPAAKPSVREPRRLAIVLDGRNPNTASLARIALEDLGDRDRVAIIDASGPRVVVPPLPGSHRTLLDGAVTRVLERPRGGAAVANTRDLAGALALARGFVGVKIAEGATLPSAGQVLVLSDGIGVAQAGLRLANEVASLRRANVRVSAVGTPDRLDVAHLAPLGDDVFAGGAFADREDAVARIVPPPGDVVLEDVELTVHSVPAPVRVLEVSGGLAALSLDHDRLLLGDLYAGEARTEIARIAMPVWVPGEPCEITVSARYRDAATGTWHTASRTIDARYEDDVERIASARHGDVIAYASALAMVRRLGRIFQGSRFDDLGGLRPVVTLQADSLAALSRSSHDPALGTQAEVLRTLLGAIED